MSRFSCWAKMSTVLILLQIVVACDGVRVAPSNTQSGDSALDLNNQLANVDSNPADNTHAPLNGLTFANGNLEVTPRIGLDEHLNSGISVSFDQLQENLFGVRCAVCHTGGGDELPGSMNFSTAAATYASLINVTSSEYPQLSLVSPGMSTNSYLVRKIEGTQLVGKQMPLQGGFLSADDIRLVKAWIDSGAKP